MKTSKYNAISFLNSKLFSGWLRQIIHCKHLISPNNKFGICNKNEQCMIYNVPYNSSLFSYKVMSYISQLPNKLHPTGIQLNSIKVSFTGHRSEALAPLLPYTLIVCLFLAD